MDYEIVVADHVYEIENKVTKLLDEGYDLVGQPFVITEGNNRCLIAQAMICKGEIK